MKSFSISVILLIFCIIAFTSHVTASRGNQQAIRCPAYVNPTENEFPIMAYTTFSKPYQITRQNFQILRDAGFNISLSHLSETSLMDSTLNKADGTGIKIMVNCTDSRNIETLASIVLKYRQNPNVMGYYIADEPRKADFTKLSAYRDTIFKYDTLHLPFVNLFPMVGSLDNHREYHSYISEFIKTVDIPSISYDNYPITLINGILNVSDNFYENLEIVSNISCEKKRPFWAFCLSGAHGKYPTPTLEHLTFEAFSALAYGAQGINYYTYGPYKTNDGVYYKSPVDINGNKTEIWDIVKTVNSQIHNLTHVFLGAKLNGVWHTGKNIPKGTKRLSDLPKPFYRIDSNDKGILVSHLSNNGTNYLVIVNHDVTDSQTISVRKDQNVRRVFPDGMTKIFKSDSVSLTPGGYCIFTW